MLEVFIALLGGAYYIGKYAHEKSKSNKANRDGQQRKQRFRIMQHDYDSWMQRVYDEYLEYQVGKLKLDDRRVTKMRERIMKEVCLSESEITTDMIFMGMLAQRKKLPSMIKYK